MAGTHAKLAEVWVGYDLSDTLLAVVHVWRSAKAGALLGLPGAPILLVPRADAACVPCVLPCVLIPAALTILQSTQNYHTSLTAHAAVLVIA